MNPVLSTTSATPTWSEVPISFAMSWMPSRKMSMEMTLSPSLKSLLTDMVIVWVCRFSYGLTKVISPPASFALTYQGRSVAT